MEDKKEKITRLVVTLRDGDAIRLGEHIRVILKYDGNKAKFVIEAPESLKISREKRKDD